LYHGRIDSSNAEPFIINKYYNIPAPHRLPFTHTKTSRSLIVGIENAPVVEPFVEGAVRVVSLY